jgi:ribosome-associated protein
MLDLQEIGVALTRLSPEKLAAIPMSEKLHDAILEASNIKKHGAIRRHMQFIGKLMRSDDSEAIVAAYTNLQQNDRNSARKVKQVEEWRDALIHGGKEKLDSFLEHYPNSDRQQLNQLIRNCQKEISQQKSQGSAKKLFRFVRDLVIDC